jgi:hypothetical protein
MGASLWPIIDTFGKEGDRVKTYVQEKLSFGNHSHAKDFAK